MKLRLSENQELIVIFLTLLVGVFLALSIVQCTQKTPAEIVQEVPFQKGPITLSWEKTTEAHPERQAWSEEVLSLFEKNMEIFDSSTDFSEVCPKYKLLKIDQKLKALGEFWVGVSLKESGFNPKDYSVDVGTKGDNGSWSVGLYQVSANDGPNRSFGYSFSDLQDPIKNIRLSLEILKKQISNTGKYLLPNSDSHRYWSTILKGNKHSAIPDITVRVRKYVPACL